MKIEYIFIKQKDDYFVTDEMFQHFLDSNNRIKFEDNGIIFEGKTLEYTLKSADVEKSNEKVFHFAIEIQGSGEEQADLIEKFDSLVKEINEKNGMPFAVNTIWNDVSSYYGEKLYPKILKVENMLRKIIYLFMLKTVGSKWIDVSAPEIFQTSINIVIEKNHKKRDEIKEGWLTYADFIMLGYFFTAPYSLKTDVKDLFKELRQYERTNIRNNGAKKADDENKIKNKKEKQLTADIIKRMSDEYEPKNNWERYFSDKLSIKSKNKFSKDWSSLYDIRNKVAHGKPINKEDFIKADELIKLYTKSSEECIEIIDTLEITAEEAKAVEAVAQTISQKEQLNAFDGGKLSTEIRHYPYSVQLNAENLLDGFKSAESYAGLGAFARSVKALSSEIDTNAYVSAMQGIEPTLSAIAPNNESWVKGAESLEKALAPLTLQMPKLLKMNVLKMNDTLNIERITAALDKPIVIDMPILKTKNINEEVKQKKNSVESDDVDSKTETNDPENQEKDNE